MPRLLIVSLGQLGGAVLEAMARDAAFDEIVVATRSIARAEAKLNNARVGAAIEGRHPMLRAEAFDLNAPDAAARLRALAPDVAFAAPSLLPWWALDRLPEPHRGHVAAVPFGGFVACHLAPMLRLREAWAASGLACPWVGASYPDVVNAVLAAGGPAPTCGVGNVAEAVPKVRFVAAAALGVPAQSVQVRLVAQHALEYFLYRAAPPSEGETLPPFLLEARHAGRDVSDLARARLFEPCPIPYELDFNLLTASAARVLLPALLGEDAAATHVPAPGGRLGGYPVRVSRRGVALDLPAAWTPELAEATNRESLRWDGIAAVEGDGTIVFTETTARALRALLGRPAERLRPDDAAAMAEALCGALAVPGR